MHDNGNQQAHFSKNLLLQNSYNNNSENNSCSLRGKTHKWNGKLFIEIINFYINRQIKLEKS